MTSFRNLQQPTNRTIHHDQNDYIFFGGTAYLGLLVNQEYQSLVKEGIAMYGLNNGTSRSNNVQLGVYDEAEESLARRFGYEDAALFSSGFLAAQATVKSLTSQGKVYYAPNSHPALWLTDKPTTLAEDFHEWIVKVVAEINCSEETNFVLIANAIDNLKPELYDFTLLASVYPSKNILLILDDSHGLAVVNKNDTAANITALWGSDNIQVALVASLAKGLGTDAGLVLGSKEIISNVKKSPIFMGASPSSPAIIYALTKSQVIYEVAYERLQENITFFDSLLNEDLALNRVKRFPVFTSTNSNLYHHLCKNDVLISSFPYPLPHSPLLNRIVISSLHNREDIGKLTEVLHSYVQ
jgi:8-amino-7-oxononanoate synthase